MTLVFLIFLIASYLLFNAMPGNAFQSLLLNPSLPPDAYEKTLKIAEKFSEYGNNVKITQHKSTDFGDMTKEEVKFWIDNAKIYEQTDRMTYLIQSITSGSIF